MDNFFSYVFQNLKQFFALSENKTYRKQRWYLTREYLQPLDFYENDCFYKIPEDSKEQLLLKLKRGIEAAKLGVKDGVLAGIFLGGFWGFLTEISDFDYIDFAFGFSEKAKDTEDEKIEIELSSQSYTIIKNLEYGKQNPVSTQPVSLFSDISKNIVTARDLKYDHEKLYPLEQEIQKSIRNSPESKPSKEKNYLNHEELFDETNILLESLNPGRGHFYNNSEFGFKKGRKNVQIVGCALIQTGEPLKSPNSDSSNETINEIIQMNTNKLKGELKINPSDEDQNEDVLSTFHEEDDDKSDDYKSFIFENLPQNFKYDESIDFDEKQIEDDELMPYPQFHSKTKAIKRIKKSRKKLSHNKSDSSHIHEVSHHQRIYYKRKIPYLVKADNLGNGYDSDQKVNKPIIAYQVREIMNPPSDAELFLQEIKKLKENFETEDQSSSGHSSISSLNESGIHLIKGYQKSPIILRNNKNESKLQISNDEESETEMKSQEELVEKNVKSTLKPGAVPVPKKRKYYFFGTSEPKRSEQKIDALSKTTETKDILEPKQKKLSSSLLIPTLQSPEPIQEKFTGSKTKNSQSEITPNPREKKSAVSLPQTSRSVTVFEPQDAPISKTQDAKPSPEQRVFVIPTPQFQEPKSAPTPHKRKSVTHKSPSSKSATVSEPHDAPKFRNQDVQPPPEQRVFVIPTPQIQEPKSTPTPHKRKSVTPKSPSSKSATVSEPHDAAISKTQDAKPSPEQRVFVIPTPQFQEPKSAPTPHKRKSVTPKSPSSKSATVSEPHDAPKFRNQDVQPPPEQRFFVIPTPQFQEPKSAPTPHKRKPVAPRSKVTKTEEKELKEDHPESIGSNQGGLSTINQNLIFLYACNCAIILGVICCGLSVFRASMI